MKSSEVTLTNDEGALNLSVFWSVVFQYRRLVAGVVGVFGLATAIISLIQTPIYRAEVVVVEAQQGNMGGMAALASQFSGIAGMAGLDLGSIGGHGPASMGVLESRWLVEEFVKRNGLVPTLLPDKKSRATVWMATDVFRKKVILIKEDKLKSVTKVSVDWPDPRVAAQWANGLVALANELLRAHAINEGSADVAYLKEQVANTNDVELRRVLYDLVENETKNLMMANGRQEFAFTVVDPAVPPEIRYSPKRTLMVLVGLFLGFIVGSIAAFAHRAYRRHKANAALGS